MDTHQVIAVSGIMGSGKTTLCRGLARELGWKLLPELLLSKQYLKDFFSDMEKYAYPTQLGFLCNKSLQLIQSLKVCNNIILDRSLYEDIYVFATYFYKTGAINSRDWSIYIELAEYFLTLLPKPSILLYCDCPTQIAEKRVEKRNRADQTGFPEGHMKRIQEQYTEWLSSFSEAPVYKIDSVNFDLRKAETVKKIVSDIKLFQSTSQLSIFDNVDLLFPEKTFEVLTKTSNNVEAPSFDGAFGSKQKAPQKRKKTEEFIEYPNNPWAYLAAPFTSVAEEDVLITKERLFDIPAVHGKIKPGEYRSMLQSVEKKLHECSIETLIPHRDINQWGKRILTPQEAVLSCTESVLNADMFIGILGHSSGAHYEYGIARGKGIPSVIIICEEIESSFIASGLENDDMSLLIMNCTRISDIPKLFSSKIFFDYLSRNGLL